MDTSILIHNATPDELTTAILKGVQNQFDELKNQFQPQQPTEYLTRNEVKELLKVDLATVWSWTKKGKLKAYSIGNRVYFRRDEIEQAFTRIN